MSMYNTELQAAKLNKSGIATEAGWIIVYSVEPELREFQGVAMEYLAVGVGLPTLSYADKPELPGDGLALVRSADGKRWEAVPDYRGLTAYSTENGQSEVVTFAGELPDSLTLLEPSTPYDKWDGAQWITDMAAQHADDVAAAEQQKQALLTDAQNHTAGWQTDLQLGVITDEDKESLISWRSYIRQLQAVDTSAASDIDWPVPPQI